MLIFKILLVSLLAVGISSQTTTSAPSRGACRLWCQLPCFYPWQTVQYYCCDTHVKTGRCPPVRPICPRTLISSVVGGSTILSPPICQSDQQCSGTDKCCYDQCLLHYTCKPAE